MHWIRFISVIVLFLIAFCDFKSRMIPVVFLSGEAVLSLILGYEATGMVVMKWTAINFVITVIQLGVLLIWVKTKDAESANLLTKFGAGDVFMMAIAAINFSTLNYLLFIIAISIFTLTYWLLKNILTKVKDPALPFAGFLAAGLMIVRILEITGVNMNYESIWFC